MPSQAGEERLDISEHGRGDGGERTSLDRRLYFQLLAFGSCRDNGPLIRAMDEARLPGVLYEDVNDAFGVGLLTFSEEPDFFLDVLRPFLRRSPFAELPQKGELTMFGRTYARGYEQNLEEALIGRPRRRVLDPEVRWAIWYPLRRSGRFETLEEKEQRAILAEHGAIGRSFGAAGHAYDIRLACHGLNREDNDFVIGVLGRELYPLSLVVQRMRTTRQTSEYLERLGPFFTGRAVRQAQADGDGTLRPAQVDGNG